MPVERFHQMHSSAEISSPS